MDLSYGSEYEAFRAETRQFIATHRQLAPDTLGLDGTETFDIAVDDDLTPRQTVTVTAHPTRKTTVPRYPTRTRLIPMVSMTAGMPAITTMTRMGSTMCLSCTTGSLSPRPDTWAFLFSPAIGLLLLLNTFKPSGDPHHVTHPSPQQQSGAELWPALQVFGACL